MQPVDYELATKGGWKVASVCRPLKRYHFIGITSYELSVGTYLEFKITYFKKSEWKRFDFNVAVIEFYNPFN